MVSKTPSGRSIKAEFKVLPNVLYERNERLIHDKDEKISLLENESANYGQMRLPGSVIAKLKHLRLKFGSLSKTRFHLIISF